MCCFSLYRAGCVSTALCLLVPSACFLLCMSASFCLRPRGSLCQSSRMNSTGSISKARTTILNHRPKLSTSWVKCAFPRPCRQTFSPETCSHSHRGPQLDPSCFCGERVAWSGSNFHINEKYIRPPHIGKWQLFFFLHYISCH